MNFKCDTIIFGKLIFSASTDEPETIVCLYFFKGLSLVGVTLQSITTSLSFLFFIELYKQEKVTIEAISSPFSFPFLMARG